MKICWAVLLLAMVSLVACGQEPPAKGEKGDAGPPGPPGAPGPPGPPSPGHAIRFADITCQQASCITKCNDNERVLAAHVLSGVGVIVIDNDRQATYRPARGGQAGKFVLVCISQ
jgi:hypothetical protein